MIKFCIFDVRGENHIGLLMDEKLLDFSRSLQAYRLLMQGEMTPLATDMVPLMREGLFTPDLFGSVLSFIREHNLADAFSVLDQPKLRAPIPRPAKIIALGGGYHFEGEEDPAEPPLFFKVSSSIIGHAEPIIYKKILKEISPELELAVVIGKKASNVSRDQAADCVAGYTIFNDVTARALQMAKWDSGFWTYTKNIDTFSPMGPYLVPPTEISDPQQLDMALRVNGKTLLQANTSTMLFSIPQVIEYVSTYVTLEPGDVIATGTPGHIGPLRPGDVVELTIAEIGTLSNPVVTES